MTDPTTPDLHDAVTHRKAWMRIFHSVKDRADNDADRAYIEHERRALANLLDDITRPAPAVTVKPLDEKRAPVQGYSPGIPWELHLRAYDAYCKKWSPQPALIDLEGRNCRGGFGTGELDMFVPHWREWVDENNNLRAEISRLSAIQPEAPDEDEADNQLCDERADGPFVKVDIEDLSEAPTPPTVQEAAKVSVLTMQLSGDREEYYVRIACGDRTMETNKYTQGYKNRADYEADTLRHVLLNEPKPDLMDPKYDDPEQPPAPTNGE